ncbi:MAG: hypothetical protein JST04_00265 [Bdellovibrionales bacterium]|nr:hypothetical protein [Bdellovibrionales bacterium]
MKLLRASAAFATLLPLAAAHAANPLCKTSYDPKLDEIRYQNFDLTPADEASSRGDCVDQIVRILDSRRLPEVAGKPIPVHLVYELTDDEMFPVIERILGADPNRALRTEIKFSIPAELDADEPLTEIEATIREKP